MKKKNKSNLIKLIGIISAIGYILVFLLLWIYTNFNGYTYFQGGEPNLFIKYIEWTLGIVALYVLGNELYEKIS